VTSINLDLTELLEQGNDTMSTQPDFVWSHCNACGQETKHNVVHRAAYKRTFDDDHYPRGRWLGMEDAAVQRL
jgi:hypothetical protein